MCHIGYHVHVPDLDTLITTGTRLFWFQAIETDLACIEFIVMLLFKDTGYTWSKNEHPVNVLPDNIVNISSSKYLYNRIIKQNILKLLIFAVFSLKYS